MRGWILALDVKLMNLSVDRNWEFHFAPRIGAADVYVKTFTISAGTDGWKTLYVNEFWDYDNLFVWIKRTGAPIGETYLYADIVNPYTNADYYHRSNTEPYWNLHLYAPAIRVHMESQAHYPVPVEGTVSVKSLDYGEVDPNVYYTLRKQQGFFVLIAVNLPSATPQFYQLRNPAGSGKTVVILRHFVHAYTAAPADSQIGTATEADATGTVLTIQKRYIGGAVDSVCTVQMRSTTGAPAGWANLEFLATPTTYSVASINICIVVPPGKSVWFFFRQSSGSTANVYGGVEWVEI